MNKLLFTTIGRLRLLGFLEGASLLTLLFIAMPIKYLGGNPELVSIIGPLHGALFLLFLLNTLQVSLALKWSFSKITWKILIACMIPFGTFYIDRQILRFL